MKQTRAGHRGLTAAVLVVGGGALTVGTWLGGQHGLAVALVVFYAVASVVAYLWAGGKGDVAAIMRAGADERQRTIDRDAASITAFAMSWAAIVGVAVESARHGNPGTFELMCAVSGLTYAGSLVALRRRR
jgi:hypothetical protein